MTFAPAIPHSRPPGRDVGTGQTVSRVPLSRVMVPAPFAKFVHMLFAVCLWEICVLAAIGSSLWPAVIMKVPQDFLRIFTGFPQDVLRIPSRMSFVFFACECACAWWLGNQAKPVPEQQPQHIAKIQIKSVILVEFLHEAKIKKSLSFLWNSCMMPKSKKSLSFYWNSCMSHMWCNYASSWGIHGIHETMTIIVLIWYVHIIKLFCM